MAPRASPASVSVVVGGIDGNVVYVLGKVLKPGPVVMTGQLSVLQVLSLAGGLDKFADDDAIADDHRRERAALVSAHLLAAERDRPPHELLVHVAPSPQACPDRMFPLRTAAPRPCTAPQTTMGHPVGEDP